MSGKDFLNSRLKEERLRLGLSQPDVGTACGVSKTTVVSWEKEAKFPAEALSALIPHGLDALYVLTGQRGLSQSKDNWEGYLDQCDLVGVALEELDLLLHGLPIRNLGEMAARLAGDAMRHSTDPERREALCIDMCRSVADLMKSNKETPK